MTRIRQGSRVGVRWASGSACGWLAAFVLAGLFVSLQSFEAATALAAGDATKAACPNEAMPGFRSYLPDCRAYELVSPSFKDGFPVFLETLTADGGRLKALSVGHFADATGPRCTLIRYDLARGASGWTTTPFADAPLTEFAYTDPPGSECQFPLSDEGAVLLELRPVSHSVYERDLYLRRPDGSLTSVGPMLPPSGFPSTPTGTGEAPEGEPGAFDLLGASRDLSHVLFTLEPLSPSLLPPGIATQLWPSDTTMLKPIEGGGGASSLYEYVGTGNTVPTLVGVDNSGHLISDCGTELGDGGSASTRNHLNAISADGSRVFFTSIGASGGVECGGVVGPLPPVEELFARVGGFHTVAVSEPSALSPAPPNEGCSTPECTASTTEPANFRDANFEGASADGARVFFTSPQQLLDRATQDPNPKDSAVNQGRCEAPVGANGCNLYEYEFVNGTEGRLKLLSGGDSSGLGPEVQGVAGISEDGSHVYFVAKGVLTREPRGDEGEEELCLKELSPVEKSEEETTKEGRCRPKKEQNNLYVIDTSTGKTAFIATLSPSDSAQWPFNGESSNHHGPMEVTDDGRSLVFTSREHLTAGDSSVVQQVFRYDAATGALVRISVGNDGFGSNGNAELGETFITRAFTGAHEATTIDRHPAISEDGRVVVFESSVALTSGALDNRCAAEEEGECVLFARNLYEFREGHVYLISDGRDVGAHSTEGVVSPSGEDIFFNTNDSLVPEDTDTLGDIYDARVEGGFPAPAGSALCGEACQGAPSTTPVFGSPGSATLAGSGNLTSPTPSTTVASKKPVKCPKAKKLLASHGKCVKTKARKKKKKAKAKSHRAGR